jgi:peptidoglycan/xylan/chitin deacetylase (PgdA/CDA1 family)
LSDVLVLCYHAVSPTWNAALSVTPTALEDQLSHLVSRGWRGASFRDAVLDPPGERTLAVTFDDAFSSVRSYALPILDRLGLPGTVFAPTAYMAGGRELDWEGVSHWQQTRFRAELEPMDWAGLRDLADRGWEIGSHTRSHPHLTRLDGDTLRAELETSREECTGHIGRPCETIAYPYGDVNDQVAAASRSAGYLAGACLSSTLKLRGPHLHPRIGIYNRDVAWRFRLKVMRPMRRLRASDLWMRAG